MTTPSPTASLPDFETITVGETDDEVLLVTLNRPDRLDAMTSTMITELGHVVDAVDLDAKLRVVIVTGAGRGCNAGLDLQSQGTAPGAEGVSQTVSGFMWQDHRTATWERATSCHASSVPRGRRS